MNRSAPWGFSPSLIALVYAIVGFGMLFLSDFLLPRLANDPLLGWLQGFKGAIEVGLTALVLYFVVRVAFDELFVKNRMVDQATVGITLTEPGNDSIQFVNSKLKSMTHYSESELLGGSHDRLWADPDDETVEVFREACREAKAGRVEIDCVRADGSTFVDSVQISSVSRNGQPKKVVVFHRDITEKKDYERRLKRSLENNRTLLKEIHHRVKNNMQVLLSLIGLQMRELDDGNATDCLRRTRRRIRSMGLIHEKLYENNEMRELNFKEYVEELVTEIAQSQMVSEADVPIEIRVEPINLDLDVVVSLGLVINELVTNSIQHARPGGEPTDIKVVFKREDSRFTLVVSDDGQGASRNDLQEGSSLGIRLVRRLVEDQLNGTLGFFNDDGLRTEITLPENEVLENDGRKGEKHGPAESREG